MEKMSQVGVYFYPNRSQADYSEPLQLQILGSTYRRPGWAMKESYSTVRHSINPQRPCESRRTLILNSQSGLKPFSHNQGRIFALETDLESVGFPLVLSNTLL